MILDIKLLNINQNRKVKKKSGKPFKSGKKINTVRGETVNPYTNKIAYTFFEDTSIVNTDVCTVINKY